MSFFSYAGFKKITRNEIPSSSMFKKQIGRTGSSNITKKKDKQIDDILTALENNVSPGKDLTTQELKNIQTETQQWLDNPKNTSDNRKSHPHITELNNELKRQIGLLEIQAKLKIADQKRNEDSKEAISALREVRHLATDWLVKNPGDNLQRAAVGSLAVDIDKAILEKIEIVYKPKTLKTKKEIKGQFKNVMKELTDTTPLAGEVSRTIDSHYLKEYFTEHHLPKMMIETPYGQWEKIKSQVPFEIWLQEAYISRFEDDEFGQMNSLYANKNERNPVQINNGYIKDVIKIMNGEKEGVKYLDENERKKYVINIDNGVLKDAKGKKYDTKNKETAFSGKGTAIFVLGPDDTLYSESHKVNEFHHSSFLSGSRIKCAGEIVVDDGNVVGMTPKTGHYKSLDEHFQAMLEHLEEKGIDLAKVAVQFPFDKDFKTKHFNAYEVLHEVYKKEDQELKDITAYDERGEACKAQVTKSVQI